MQEIWRGRQVAGRSATRRLALLGMTAGLALSSALSMGLGLGGCGDSGDDSQDLCPEGEVRLPDGSCVPACEGNEIRNDEGQCVPCGEHEVARDNRCGCEAGYVFLDGHCVEPAGDDGVLGTDWHPDPDGDGIESGEDDCPWDYDPGQSDSDGDGLGDVCDPDFAPPTENGPVTDLRAEHVTPYGAWVQFTSPRSEAYGWQGYVVWSEDRNELDDLAGVQALVDRGDGVGFTTYAPYGRTPLRPVWITALEPETTYYLRLVREDWTGLVDELSNVIEITTLAAPPIHLSSHRPRVFATPALIDDLRQRVASADSRFSAWEAELGPRVVTAAQDPDSVYLAPWYCQTAAMLYLATGSEDYRTAAMALLDMLITYWEDNALDGNAYRWANAALGVCADLLWDDLDAATKDRAAAAMLEDDEYHVVDEPPRPADTDEFASTVRTQLVDGLALCDATDLSGDLSDRGCAVLDAGLRGWYGVQLVKARRDRRFWAQTGGYLPDGSDYGQGTSTYWLQSFWAMHNAGDQAAGYLPWVLHNMLSMVVYPLTPSRLGYYTQGDVEDFSYNYETEPSSFQLEGSDAALVALQGLLLQAGGDLDAASWARGLTDDLFVVDHEAGEAAVWRMLFERDDLPGTDYRETLATAFLDSGLGLFFDRSGWDADDSMLVFRAGWTGVDHSHEDIGHFQLYRAGRWITHEAIAYDGPGAQAQGHNVLLLQQKADEGDPDCVCQRLQRNGGHPRILRVSSGSSHAFIQADLLGAYRSYYYHSTYYDAVQRSLIWRKTDGAGGSDLLVLYDLVDDAPDAPQGLDRGWVLQFDEEPSISGRSAGCVLPGALSGGPAQRVDVVALLPQTATLTHHAPEGQPDDFPGPLYNHRLTMDPGTDAPALRMITVLRAADQEPPALDAREIDTETMVGALVDGEAFLFPRAALGRPPEGMEEASLTLEASVPLVVWWAGFVPGRSYSVTVTVETGTVTLDVGQGDLVTADSGGLLAFSLDGGGGVSPVYR